MTQWASEEIERLANAYKLGTLPHGILLTGHKNIGKLHAMINFAQFLLCQTPLERGHCGQCKSCQLIKAGSHPDLLIVNQDGGHIGVDIVRHIISFGQKTAQLSKNKVVVVADIESMTESAANAFLKTLEEPTENTFLLMTTIDKQLLMATILSRCHIVNCQSPAGQSLFELTCTSFPLSAYTNLSHFPELTDASVCQRYYDFLQFVASWLLRDIDSQDVKSAIIDEPYAIRWLEQLLISLIRYPHQPHQIGSLSGNMVDSLVRKQPFDVLGQLHRTVIELQKDSFQINGFNRRFRIEQLLIDAELNILN